MSVSRFTQLEDNFLIENYIKMSSVELGEKMNRNPKAIENHLLVLRHKGFITRKTIQSSITSIANDIKLEMQGRKNKGYIANIRGKILLNKYINIQTEKNKETCEVIFKTFNYFTVKHKNYIESFNYTDILIGRIKLLG